MTPFPDAKHLASWAALCPGNNESAGKRESGRTRKGNPYLHCALVQAAWAPSHAKDTFFAALFFRLSQRLGGRRAAIAVAHRMLLVIFHIIRDGESYREPGGDYFDKLNPRKTARRLIRRLAALGFDASTLPATPDARSQLLKPGPGRPCKCAERGIPCPHPPRLLNPSTPRKQQQPPTAKDLPLAQTCSKRNRWSIPSIHLRPS
jgi:hypothetical protein